MENQFNDDDDRPKYVWEYFVDIPWDQEKSLGSPIMQIIHFYEQLGIEDPLYDAGFSIEEITQIVVEDADMRQFPGGPISSTNENKIDI